MNYEEFFPARLAELRLKANVSAREMSLALGHNASYINRIENKQTFPSMQSFFYICDYLNISAKEFFDQEVNDPVGNKRLVTLIEKLDDEQMKIVSSVVKGLLRVKK